MKAPQTRFVCSACGRVENKWLGRCPSCGAWNSFEEEKVAPSSPGIPASAPVSALDSRLKKLADVVVGSSSRFESGMGEFDRVLGGGIMRPSSVLVGGEPGIGKSTIMLQLLSSCADVGPVLYVSGEESPGQVRLRGERLHVRLKDINIFCDTRLEVLMDAIESLKPAVVVIDSLQTLASSSIPSMAGSVNQMRACCMALSLVAKANGIAMFLIGHVTKDGMFAGPKIVEHLVDTVLYFESAQTGVRILRSIKNRFGSVDEIGLFRMDEDGLTPVKDPSLFFISSRSDGQLPSGVAYTAVTEGSRTFLVEIQALVVPGRGGSVRVYSDKVDAARVNRICAILERHAGLRLSDCDIYINVAGGIRLNEVSIELAIALALWSAKSGTPLCARQVCFGELSLAGEVRPVAFLERRIKASIDMGFDRILAPAAMEKKDSRVSGCHNIRQAIMISKAFDEGA